MQEFKRPSNPDEKIYLQEAKVPQAMMFSDALDSHSQQVTTRFLNEVQRPERFTDSKNWTEGDRLTALIWYFIHTSQDLFVSLPYDCDFCGGKHHNNFDVRELAKVYQNLKGKPFREVSFKSKALTFKPITGEGLEAVQGIRINSEEPDSKRTKALMLFERILWSLFFSDRDASLVDRREWMNSLTATEYLALAGEYAQAQDDMKHGIEHIYDDGDTCLPIPPHQCINKYKLPEDEQGGAITTLRWPFLSNFFIPSLY